MAEQCIYPRVNPHAVNPQQFAAVAVEMACLGVGGGCVVVGAAQAQQLVSHFIL